MSCPSVSSSISTRLQFWHGAPVGGIAHSITPVVAFIGSDMLAGVRATGFENDL